MPEDKLCECFRRVRAEQRSPDVVIVAENRQISTHRAVLLAMSTRFQEELEKDSRERAHLQVKQTYKVMDALIGFMYFGGIDSELDSFEALDVLRAAKEYGVSALQDSDVVDLVVPKLTVDSCMPVLLHPEIENHKRMTRGVCEFIGVNLLEVSKIRSAYNSLMEADAAYVALAIKRACWSCKTISEFEQVLQIAMEYFKIESPVDVLAASKVWPWSALDEEAFTTIMDPNKIDPQTMRRLDAGDGSASKDEFGQMRVSLVKVTGDTEWVIPRIKEVSLAASSWRVVYGELYEWQVRLDTGADGKLRIVYECSSPHPSMGVCPCLLKFPAATFAWQVTLNGREVPVEERVFIAFADAVDLHWSTALGLNREDLQPQDELVLKVKIIENPILSLTLYHLYGTMDNDQYAEDILNRLPHIEYRCLSSYIIFRKTASRQVSRCPSPRGATGRA